MTTGLPCAGPVCNSTMNNSIPRTLSFYLGKQKISCCKVSNTACLRLNTALRKVVQVSYRHQSGVNQVLKYQLPWML